MPQRAMCLQRSKDDLSGLKPVETASPKGQNGVLRFEAERQQAIR